MLAIFETFENRNRVEVASLRLTGHLETLPNFKWSLNFQSYVEHDVIMLSESINRIGCCNELRTFQYGCGGCECSQMCTPETICFMIYVSKWQFV